MLETILNHPYASTVIGVGACAACLMVWRRLPQNAKNVIKEFASTYADVRKFLKRSQK